MKITRKNLEKSVVELTIEESVEAIAKHRKKAIAYLAEHADVQGFRKGTKIPESVLLKQYWEEHIAKMTVDFGIDELYRKALKQEKLFPVAQGDIKEVVSQSPLIFKAEIEVMPEISIDKKYKDIKLKAKKATVKADEVKAALAEIETKFTSFKEASKTTKAKMGDKVTIDTDGYEAGKLMEATSMKDYPIILGSNVLVPGFEEGVVGAKTGDTLDLDIVFPKDYHNESFAGKKTVFKVTIKKLESAVKPEFTPEFIEQLRGQKLDLAGFKDLIKSEIMDTKNSNIQLQQEEELIGELLKHTKIDLGEKLILNQMDRTYHDIKSQVTNDGIKMADYLESLKMSEEDYKEKNVRPVAIKRLQGELILHEVAKQEKIKVSDKELDVEIQKITKTFNSPDALEKLKELYVPGTKYYEELRQRLSFRKLIDSFFA